MNIYSRANSLFDTFRSETLEGIDYVVVNGVPLVETVLNGRYLSVDEFGPQANDWNGVPVVIRHPKQNDGSARVPASDVPVVGRFYNAKLDGTRLLGEFWLEKDKLDAIEDGKLLLQSIQASHPIEVSTGYYSETTEHAGHHNDVPYSFVDTNLKPDHIALLPDDIGACSVDSGCGLNRNHNHTCEFSQHNPGSDPGEKDDKALQNTSTTKYAPTTASSLRSDMLSAFNLLISDSEKSVKFDGFILNFSDVGMMTHGVIYWPSPEQSIQIQIRKIGLGGRITEQAVQWGIYELLRGNAWSLDYDSAQLEAVGDSGLTVSYEDGSAFGLVVVEGDVIDYDVRKEDFPTARDDISLHLKNIPRCTLDEFVEYFASVEA